MINLCIVFIYFRWLSRPKTNLQYAFSNKDSIVSANVYLVFKDINSVMQSGYFSFRDKEYNSGFEKYSSWCKDTNHCFFNQERKDILLQIGLDNKSK